MSFDLDHLLAALRHQPSDPRLDQLEPSVWLRVRAPRRRQMQTGIWAWRAALAAAMAALGVLGGGPDSRRPQEVSPFAIHAEMAPSTLLEGDT